MDIRDRIMEAAMSLIHEGTNDPAALTTRVIAQRAGVGIGLINYHFQTKDHLIELCVARMIVRVIAGFQPAVQGEDAGPARLAHWAVQVFDFLFDNPALSRISILSDMKAFTPGCNTAMTRRGFARALGTVFPESRTALIAFALTSAMQSAFLSPPDGYAFGDKAERDRFIHDLVRTLCQEGHA